VAQDAAGSHRLANPLKDRGRSAALKNRALVFPAACCRYRRTARG
jgi:hypothetical protein